MFERFCDHDNQSQKESLEDTRRGRVILHTPESIDLIQKINQQSIDTHKRIK